MGEWRSPEAPCCLTSQLSGQLFSCGTRPHTARALAGLAGCVGCTVTPVWSQWLFLSPSSVVPALALLLAAPSLPALLYCPISEPGLGLCAASSPPWPPRQAWSGSKVCSGAELAPCSSGCGGPRPPESTEAQVRRGLQRGLRGAPASAPPVALCRFQGFGVCSAPCSRAGSVGCREGRTCWGPRLAAWPIF